MQIYLVGGAVRDQLLKRSIKERDYVVVGATEKQMLSEGYTRVGKDFPVFLHPKTKEEYALARTERKKGFGYSGFECHTSPNVTLEQDLQRRDLTINAMAVAANDEIIDPYNGQNDLNKRIFRHVSEAFAEDPLRVFRIARFMARYHGYGFEIAPETLALMQAMCTNEEMQAISAERIWQETARALMEPHPYRYFQVLKDAGALGFWFSEWRSVDFYSDEFMQINGLRDDEPQTLEQRFATICCMTQRYNEFLNEPNSQLDPLRTRLKLPNAAYTLARLTLIEAKRWGFGSADLTITATDLLQGFDEIDLWRNPQRLTHILDCLRFLFPQHRQKIVTIQTCAKRALEIDVQTIIASGKRGAEIKAALMSARLAQIQSQLDQPSNER